MGLYDTARRLTPAPLWRLFLLSDAVWRLGPRWIAFRIGYGAKKRSGWLEHRSPRSAWPPLEPCESGLPTIIAADVLREWLLENTSDERRAQLMAKVETLRDRRFNVFGHDVKMVDWHHEPVSGGRFDPAAHWSKVSTPEDTDIKFIWEPSRFGWAFDLARAHLLDPTCGAASLFWELFDEWCEQNPPNTGVNWSCGQEASIRLMAAICAASAMRDATDEHHAEALQRLAWVTADRVFMNIGYARSQKNNHHASEAVGLLSASLMFPGHERASNWRILGECHLREVCEVLVFEDGGTSQYSTNYHRVFVHNFVWAVHSYREVGIDAPTWLCAALDRSSRFLTAMVEPISGFGPFFGADDGSRILPLSEYPHRFLAADAVFATASVTPSAFVGSTWEPCAWFGLADPSFSSSTSEVSDGRVWARSFPESGVHVLAAGANRVIVRAGEHRFRPAQDDLLQCDAWLDGINVTPDSGTASYAGVGAGMLDSSWDHNGPRRPGRGLMRRVSRFLWADWSSGRAESLTSDLSTVGGSFVAFDHGVVLRRTVSLTADQLEIEDSADDDGALVVAWRLPDDLDAAGWTAEIVAEFQEEANRSFSPGYGTSAEAIAKVARTDHARRQPLRLRMERRRRAKPCTT